MEEIGNYSKVLSSDSNLYMTDCVRIKYFILCICPFLQGEAAFSCVKCGKIVKSSGIGFIRPQLDDSLLNFFFKNN